MNRSEELQQRRDKIDTDRTRKLEELEREERILRLLPESVALPRFCFTGSKLYGTQASLSYGESYSFNTNKYSLSEALALVDSISLEVINLYTVKDSCLAVKPLHAIAEKEHEHATIDGPFYGMKIRRELDQAILVALLSLKGKQVEIKIALNNINQFGHWHIENARGTTYRGNSEAQEGRYIKQPGSIGQAKTVQYSGGGYVGRSSAGQILYLFDCREALQAYADKLTTKEVTS